jgi:hypothetical protein
MKEYNAYPQSQAHCLVAQAGTQPKPAKELALPMHGQIVIKHETLTMAHMQYVCRRRNTNIKLIA